jgi:hypothetical protein
VVLLRGLALRRGLPVRPVAQRDAETAHPMHVEATLRAVEGEVLKLAFEVGLHLEQLETQQLGVDDERVGAAVPDFDRLVDELVRFGCLLGDLWTACSRISRSRRAMTGA